MRFYHILILSTGLALSCLPAKAQEAEPQVAAPETAEPLKSEPTAQERIDALFAELKRERTPEKARNIAGRIWSAWRDSGSSTVNLLMKWADDAAREKRNAAALDFLDRATLLDPDSPGAWNRRATLHYEMGNSRRAMSDISRVLIREPRHFGALAAMARILEDNNETAAALKAWERYLEIYPADRDAQKKAGELSEKLAGNRA